MEEVYVKGGQMLAGSDKSLKMNSQESTNEALSRGKNDAWGDEEWIKLSTEDREDSEKKVLWILCVLWTERRIDEWIYPQRTRKTQKKRSVNSVCSVDEKKKLMRDEKN